ncbi:DeoR/GlpR family DNA-binding transcription regulator [Treponema putidum]|uniref:DeoR/GlpR transcriptional regulator n=1 Tax=Treponema putidum TaxID=221027 RepID=A0ABY5HT21_9SPIR|nr:DeoR/GlpR family DNA-binding transcription regulator [Treponema putidum]UTY28587.1 DeoR/GlpR transcriptional regulator [Treponema putidum]
MYVEERLELILKDLNRYGKLNVKALAEKFKVTPMTIRRDLNILEEKGLLLKSHGGALSKESLSHDKLYSTRKKENLPVKKKIAAKALLFIKNGMTILLDAGTTNYELAKFLVESSIKDLVIITNDLKIACVLAEKQFFQIIMLGGIIENENILTCGSVAVSMLKDFEIDACFVGTQSISNKFEIRTPNIAKVELKKTYIEKSQQRFLLTDSSKFEKSKLYKICDLKDFHYIITDKKMNLSEKNYIKKYKIAWVSIDP